MNAKRSTRFSNGLIGCALVLLGPIGCEPSTPTNLRNRPQSLPPGARTKTPQAKEFDPSDDEQESASDQISIARLQREAASQDEPDTWKSERPEDDPFEGTKDAIEALALAFQAIHESTHRLTLIPIPGASVRPSDIVQAVRESPRLIRADSPFQLRFRYGDYRTDRGELWVEAVDVLKFDTTLRSGFQSFQRGDGRIDGQISLKTLPTMQQSVVIKIQSMTIRRPNMKFELSGEFEWRSDASQAWVSGKGQWTRTPWTYELEIPDPVQVTPGATVLFDNRVSLRQSGTPERDVRLPGPTDETFEIPNRSGKPNSQGS